MDKLYSPAKMAQLRAKHDFRHSKSLGQNFLSDKNIIDAIIEGSEIGAEDLVIEIGPGMGVLTAAAAECASRVVAVEIDRHLIPILTETLEDYDNVELINADVMKTDLSEVVEKYRTSGKVRIIGNLPYYITTPIVMKLLEERVPADSNRADREKKTGSRYSSPDPKAIPAPPPSRAGNRMHRVHRDSRNPGNRVRRREIKPAVRVCGKAVKPARDRMPCLRKAPGAEAETPV